jgi:hypothetical protein
MVDHNGDQKCPTPFYMEDWTHRSMYLCTGMYLPVWWVGLLVGLLCEDGYLDYPQAPLNRIGDKEAALGPHLENS